MKFSPQVLLEPFYKGIPIIKIGGEEGMIGERDERIFGNS